MTDHAGFVCNQIRQIEMQLDPMGGGEAVVNKIRMCLTGAQNMSTMRVVPEVVPAPAGCIVPAGVAMSDRRMLRGVLLCSTHRSHRSIASCNDATLQFNGVVLEVTQGREDNAPVRLFVRAVPPPAVTPVSLRDFRAPQTQAVLANMLGPNMRFLRSLAFAEDGTTVTVYNCDGAWRIATANGYDVSDLKWAGACTFREVVDTLLAQHGASVDKLQPLHGYTFIIHWGEYHPCEPNRQSITFLRRTFIDYGPGAVNTFIMDAAEMVPEIGTCPAQPAVPEDHLAWQGFEVMRNILNSSVEKCRTLGAPDPATPGARLPLYGFVFTTTTAVIVVESQLLATVRSMLYSGSRVRGEVAPEHRYTVSALNALVRNNEKRFVEMFPALTERCLRPLQEDIRVACECVARQDWDSELSTTADRIRADLRRSSRAASATQLETMLLSEGYFDTVFRAIDPTRSLAPSLCGSVCTTSVADSAAADDPSEAVEPDMKF